MISRYVPNEAACPVPVELLATLLRSTDEKVASVAAALPLAQRAALAGFCFSRSHMRELSLKLAAKCDVVALRLMAGAASEALIDQSRDLDALGRGPDLLTRNIVPLRRSAA